MKLSIPTTPAQRAVALSRYSELMEPPLVIVSLVFLIAYSWQVIGMTTGSTDSLLEGVIFVTWAVFLLDYIITISLTEKGKRLTVMNIVNLAVVVLPVFRTLRLLRVVTLLRVFNRSASMVFRKKLMLYIVGTSALLTYIGALAVYDAERHDPNANIVNFGDALWWAFITISTVGFGDRFPVTSEGRVIAVGLIISGVSLLGLITVTMGTWVMSMLNEIHEQELADEITDDLELELHKAKKKREELALKLNEASEHEALIEAALESRKTEQVA
jgi:voltage-gated potassium channel